MTEDWQSQRFRQNAISKIHDLMPANAQDQTKNARVVENHIFRKSRTRDEYLSLLAKLFIHYSQLNRNPQMMPMGAGGAPVAGEQNQGQIVGNPCQQMGVAHSAVTNQHAAAKQAAYIAQNTLVQAASQAAATAQAALVGKQVVLEALEQQAAEAQRSLSRELEQLKAAKISARLAQQTAQAAHHHISLLTAAVNNAKSVADQAEQTATEVNNQLASQSQMVGQAKNRLEQVEEQLHQARVDYAATKESALKAANSAATAQVKEEPVEPSDLGISGEVLRN